MHYHVLSIFVPAVKESNQGVLIATRHRFDQRRSFYRDLLPEVIQSCVFAIGK